MYISITTINIKRLPTDDFPTRDGTLIFDFVCEWEANDNWRNLTNKAKIKLPKNIYCIDRNGRTFPLGNINTPLSGFEGIPSFLRGDEVQIISGYRYDQDNQEITDTTVKFEGFITKVSSKSPFELECEDNMWILKQTPAKGGDNGVFAYKKYNVEDMIRELFKNAGLSFTVNALTKTNIGIDFRINNNTIAQVLEELRKQHYMFAYFRGNELRIGSEVYIDSEARTHKFAFQKNIIDDDLVYKRKDDIVLSALASSTNKVLKGGTTRDGHAKTKTEKLEVLATYQNGKFRAQVKLPGSHLEFAENTEGERHEFYYNNITDPNILIAEAKAQLKQYYYDGFRGKFTVFGIPHVKHGDNVVIEDDTIKDRVGTYKVKSVEYSGGVNGMRQVIELDYRINLINNG